MAEILQFFPLTEVSMGRTRFASCRRAFKNLSTACRLRPHTDPMMSHSSGSLGAVKVVSNQGSTTNVPFARPGESYSIVYVLEKNVD